MADVHETITLEFCGYWRKPTGIPAVAGIYCVYTCVHNKDEKTVTIDKLVYIGESGDMQDRVANHSRMEAWKKKLTSGQVLCFSAAGVGAKTTRQRAEAALIFKHKPPVNDEYKSSFPFDTTKIKASGKTAVLTTSFTVEKNATS